MAKSKPLDLTRDFNKTIGALVGGLQALRQESDGKIAFTLTTDSGSAQVFIETNIPLYAPDTPEKKQATVGMYVYHEGTVMAAACRKTARGTTLRDIGSFRDKKPGVPDVHTSAAVLKEISLKAKAHGLIP